VRGEQYIRTALRMGWLLRELEQALDATPDCSPVDGAFIRASVATRLSTPDEIDAAAGALTNLGVLRQEGTASRFSKEVFQETAGFRSGVWETLRIENRERAERSEVRLCIAVPPGLDTTLEDRMLREGAELRAAVLEVVASAKHDLILASPFWDEETTEEIADLLTKRLDAGVQVCILGRFTEASPSPMSAILRRLAAHECCRVLAWFSATPSDRSVQTFHFKAAVADEGRVAYLGSANLTTYGLRSRMELGVILSGEAARQLYRIIGTALTLARPAF
jgi:PLD-like domain